MAYQSHRVFVCHLCYAVTLTQISMFPLKSSFTKWFRQRKEVLYGVKRKNEGLLVNRPALVAAITAVEQTSVSKHCYWRANSPITCVQIPRSIDFRLDCENFDS